MLRIYDTAIALLKLLGPAFDKIAERDPDLARQGRRAGTSVALNIAEGAGVGGGNRRTRYRTALGSALEVRGVLDIAEAQSYAQATEQMREMLRHIVGVLTKVPPLPLPLPLTPTLALTPTPPLTPPLTPTLALTPTPRHGSRKPEPFTGAVDRSRSRSRVRIRIRGCGLAPLR